MSDNSSAASSRPFLPGYTIAWDDEAEEWVARSDSRPDTVLRGKDQRALDSARARLVMNLAGDMRRIFEYAPNHGYSPPPRT